MNAKDRKALVEKLEGADAELVLMTQNDRVVLDREILKALIETLRSK